MRPIRAVCLQALPRDRTPGYLAVLYRGVITMALRRIALAGLCAAALAGCAAQRDFHGYIPDQALPTDVQPTVDTRSTVLARLGTPSTTSLFDDKLWVYMSSTRELLTFYYPRVVQREIVAIQFDDGDVGFDVLVYGVN